jgi:hypothetical protein
MSANRLEQPAEPKSRIKEASKVDTFHPREHAILAKYLGQEDKLPEEAKTIDPEEIFPEEENYDEAEQGIACQKSHGGNDYRALKNAVARIALAPIRTSLPTWGGYGPRMVCFIAGRMRTAIHCPSVVTGVSPCMCFP